MANTALIIATTNPPRGALERKVLKTGIFDEIVVCTGGECVIKTLGETKIDLICWAYSPDQDTSEWLEATRINPAWADLPILVFTKEGDTDNRLRGLEMGACDSVTYVVPTAELAARFEVHLKRSKQIAHLRNRRAELAQMALNDPLTGLGNRTSFDLRLGQEISRSRRSGISFGLLLIDLDHFKWFNDCYGHQAGDTILKSVSRTIQNTIRESDFACRYGGEEFAIILPSTTTSSATNLSDRLHKAISELSRDLWQNERSLTASIGLSCFDGTRLVNSGEMIGEADAALYLAKENGRNRTEIFQPKTQPLSQIYEQENPTRVSLPVP